MLCVTPQNNSRHRETSCAEREIASSQAPKLLLNCVTAGEGTEALGSKFKPKSLSVQGRFRVVAPRCYDR